MAILVIDAVEGLTAQDAHIAGYVVEEGKGLLVAVNKWDLLTEKSDRTFDQYVDWIRKQAPFLDFAPVLSISAKTGQRVERVLETAIDIWGERRKRVSTGELNRLIGEAAERVVAPIVKGRRPKLFYATQVAVAPPTFVFFAREAGSVHFCYRRYLENRLREAFGFDGTPIRLIFRERSAIQLPRDKGEGKGKRTKARTPVRRWSGSGDDPAGAGESRREPPPTVVSRAEQRRDVRPRIVVVGTGAWGTTMGALLARREPVGAAGRRPEKVDAFAPRAENDENLPGIIFRPGLTVSADDDAFARPISSIFAVPSAHLRETVGLVAPTLSADADVLSLVEGLEGGSLLRMSEVIAEAAGMDVRRVAALSGPNLAAEIARRPAGVGGRRRRGPGARAAGPGSGRDAARSGST